jgi:hypothetical protein
MDIIHKYPQYSITKDCVEENIFFQVSEEYFTVKERPSLAPASDTAQWKIFTIKPSLDTAQ